jgi:hypothetical protein
LRRLAGRGWGTRRRRQGAGLVSGFDPDRRTSPVSSRTSPGPPAAVVSVPRNVASFGPSNAAAAEVADPARITGAAKAAHAGAAARPTQVAGSGAAQVAGASAGVGTAQPFRIVRRAVAGVVVRSVALVIVPILGAGDNRRLPRTLGAKPHDRPRSARPQAPEGCRREASTPAALRDGVLAPNLANRCRSGLRQLQDRTCPLGSPPSDHPTSPLTVGSTWETLVGTAVRWSLLARRGLHGPSS